MANNNFLEAVDNIPSFNSDKGNNSFGDTINVNRGKIESITIYEVYESELEVFESGAPSSIFLNFTTFFEGIFLSFLPVLLTVSFDFSKYKDFIAFLIFCIIDIVTFFLTVIMFIIWLRKRKDLKHIITGIKERIK